MAYHSSACSQPGSGSGWLGWGRRMSRRRLLRCLSHLVADTETADVDLDRLLVTDPAAPLTKEQIDHFMLEGYVALPGLIPVSFNTALKADVDALMADRASNSARLIASYGTLGELCSYPPVVDKVRQLMKEYGNGETECGMHHIHANRQAPGTGSSNWHQDYHSAANTYLREQLMVHVFYYLDGLDGTIGDLMILPRSQYAHWDGGSMQAIFGDRALPGSKTFGTGTAVPQGTAVICHSALVHGRRKRPGGSFRYFADVSYCQPGERQWPNDMQRKEEERALAAAKGLDHAGKYDSIWNSESPSIYNIQYQ